MKIIYEGGFENLDEYKYLYKRDVFRRKNLYYKFIKSCSVCGKSFFMRLTYPTNFCSTRCSNKSDIVRSKISKSLIGNKKSPQECKNIAKRMSKGGVTKKNIPLYDTYAHQLLLVEEVKDDAGILKVRCSVCGEWFMPKRTHVESRAQYIKGNIDRESKFYCSGQCKSSCSIFNKHKYPVGKNIRKNRNNNYFLDNELRTWSKEVLKLADNKCEYCGKKATVAHHIEPKKLEPGLALDPINGIACCSECHYKYGHKDECSTGNLSKVSCI